LSERPWGVYVHVPWCRRRCPYCDFYFEIGAADPRFPTAVAEELRARRREAPEGPAATLYLGGGTPSALSDEAVAAVVASVRGHAGLAEDAEITLEANPEDLPPGRLERLAAAGITRLSLGVQSFSDEVLRWLGRAHDEAKASRVIEEAVAALPRVSVDLICGVPGEPAHRLEADVQRLAQLGVGHVSAYLLSVEEGTPLVQLIARGKREALDEERQADAYEALQALLPARGLCQYEVSSFARAGEESRHNRLYWAKGSYLGLGPGAHSMRLREDGSVVRRHTTARAAGWLAEPAGQAFEEEILGAEEAFLEAVAFGLRDVGAGVDLEALAARHRVLVPASLGPIVAQALDDGLLARGGEVLRLTERGARFSDAVARSVLAASFPKRAG
jgi:oxygen-independent coproporphyrinogen III oxidase